MYQLIQTEPELILKGPQGLLRLYPVNENVVRITMTGRDHFLEEPETENRTPVVLDKTPVSCYEVEEKESDVTLKLAAFSVKVNLDTGALSYLDPAGTLLVREPDKGGRHLVETQVTRNLFSQDGELEEHHSADGVKVVGGSYETVPDRMAYEAKVEFVFGDEGLYGLGSHEEGYGNLRGKSRMLFQQNMKACVPAFFSSKGYGFLFDCRSLMTFEDTGFGSYVWMDLVDELDYYFLAGPSYETALAAYRKLTGSAPLLPKWAYGYGQSREHYQSAQELIATVEEYRRRKVPLSFIIQDWQSWEPGLWGQKSFDPARYPDPHAMMARLHQLHAPLMVSIWPNLNGMGENQKELLEAGHLLGNRSTYNAFSKAARDMYWNQAKEGIFRHGVDAWWCDCTEPFEADWIGFTQRPVPHRRAEIATNAAKTYLDGGEWMAYSLCHSRGIYEGQRRETEEKRVVNLTRSAFAGQHRYATVTWSGDIGSNWETLKRQVPEGQNFSAAGEPYWSLDIGGFFAAPGEDWFRTGEYPQGSQDLGYRELYTRWLQLGTFLPMMRSHGADTNREIWNFGEEGTPFYDVIAKFIRLRMELLPYLYSQAAAVTRRNDTFLKPLGLAFPHDPACLDAGDQFLLGPSLLVCPVTEPMYYGAGSKPLEGVEKTRTVYLPAGCGWYDFWTGAFYQGGRTLKADAPLEKIPLYVKAGSILPLGPAVEYPAQDLHPELTLRVYPGGDGSFVLYDDEGDSYRYEQGAFTETPLRWEEASRTLTIGPRKGSYQGMPQAQTYHVVLGGREQTVTLEGEGMAALSF